MVDVCSSVTYTGQGGEESKQGDRVNLQVSKQLQAGIAVYGLQQQKQRKSQRCAAVQHHVRACCSLITLQKLLYTLKTLGNSIMQFVAHHAHNAAEPRSAICSQCAGLCVGYLAATFAHHRRLCRACHDTLCKEAVDERLWLAGVQGGVGQQQG
jgi:hypothetical protein